MLPMYIDEKPKRASRKLSEYHKDTINTAVVRLTDRYLHAIEFPLEKNDDALKAMIDSTLPQKLLDAIHVMATTPHYEDVLRTSLDTYINIDNITMNVRLNKGYPIPGSYHSRRSQHHIKPDNPYYHDISVWAYQTLELKNRAQAAKEFCRGVVGACNTSGQLFRVWPEIIHYMPKDLADTLGGAQRASQLPEAINMVEVVRQRPEATAFLAYMALVPVQSGFRVPVTVVS